MQSKKFLVNIDLVISVDIPVEGVSMPDSEVSDYIRTAIRKKLRDKGYRGSKDWLMENIGEIHPDEQHEQAHIDTEKEAYEEGRIAWAAFENSNKMVKGNPYDKGTVEFAAWNKGFNVG